MTKNTFRLRPPAHPPARNREKIYTGLAAIVKNESRKIKRKFLYRMRRYIVKNESRKNIIFTANPLVRNNVIFDEATQVSREHLNFD